MSNISTSKVLVLGSRWSGKSLLIKRLEELCSPVRSASDEFISTTSTLGKTLTHLQYKRNDKLEIHELGANFTCTWKTFYASDHFEKLLYVIDATQPWSMSVTLEQLKEIVEQVTLSSKHVLLVVNKVNEVNSINKATIRELLDLGSIGNGEIEVIETNARTGMNLPVLLEWLIR